MKKCGTRPLLLPSQNWSFAYLRMIVLLMKYICFVKWLKMYRKGGCEAGLNYLDFCQAILMNGTFFYDQFNSISNWQWLDWVMGEYLQCRSVSQNIKVVFDFWWGFSIWWKGGLEFWNYLLVGWWICFGCLFFFNWQWLAGWIDSTLQFLDCSWQIVITERCSFIFFFFPLSFVSSTLCYLVSGTIADLV